MPYNCKAVNVEEVTKFFLEEINGTGNNTRNQGVPDSIRMWKNASLCELTEDEFMRLEIPDSTGTLIKNKKDLNENSENLLKELKNGNIFKPLIIRNKLPGHAEGASFYIEDGAHRAIALKFYFDENPYSPVFAYIGQR
jgi:hypothetical protein